MVNEDFIESFPNAGDEFHPYLVSDHSLVAVCFPESYEKKIKPFRYDNYIGEKEDFLPTVASEWYNNVKGCRMYNLIMKMKKLKSKMN